MKAARRCFFQDFSGVKSITVPNQSMSLKEIIRRFVRRESLPVSHEGIYESRMGDLEKLSREDITVQMERVSEIKDSISKAEKRMLEKQKKEDAKKLEAEQKAAAAAAPPPNPSLPPPQGT